MQKFAPTQSRVVEAGCEVGESCDLLYRKSLISATRICFFSGILILFTQNPLLDYVRCHSWQAHAFKSVRTVRVT